MTAEQVALVREAKRRWADGWLPSAAEVDALFAAFAAVDEAEADPSDGLPTFQVGRY